MDIKPYYSGSAGNLYQVDDLLLEAGVPIRKIKQALGYKLSDITACLVTHEHMDHARGARDVMAAGVDLYCSGGTAEALGLNSHRLHTISTAGPFTVGHWVVLPFLAIHDAAEPLNFLISNGRDKLLFSTDTNYIPYKFRGLTHIMLGVDYDKDILMSPEGDASHQIRTLQSHMSLQTAQKFFAVNDMSQVEAIYLLHLSNTNSDARRFKEEIQKLTGRPVTIA
jgi:phosphoribosyl 1,2-cyclic phosphodiesterase